MKKLLFLVVPIIVFGCNSSSEEKKGYETGVQEVLDDWHDAASEADFARYFSHFADSNSIYMGTDATEHWSVPEFKAFSKPYFDAGRAWNFTPVSRNIMFSEDGNTAWFDEQLDTPNLGPCRGTGVLVLKNGVWKIAHYNLTVPIPNEIMGDVKDQIEKVLNTKQE